MLSSTLRRLAAGAFIVCNENPDLSILRLGVQLSGGVAVRLPQAFPSGCERFLAVLTQAVRNRFPPFRIFLAPAFPNGPNRRTLPNRPSRAVPNRPEPFRTELSRAVPNRSEPSRTLPNCSWPFRAVPNRPEPFRTSPKPFRTIAFGLTNKGMLRIAIGQGPGTARNASGRDSSERFGTFSGRFGTVRDGLEQFGSVRSGSGRDSSERFGTVRNGSERFGTDRDGSERRNVSEWFGTARNGSGRFGTARDGSGWFGTVRNDRDGSKRLGGGSGRFGTVRKGSGRFGMVRNGWGRFGTVRNGSGPFGTSTRCPQPTAHGLQPTAHSPQTSPQQPSPAQPQPQPSPAQPSPAQPAAYFWSKPHRRAPKALQTLPSSHKKRLHLAVLRNCTGKCGSLKHSQGLPIYVRTYSHACCGGPPRD